MLKYMKKNIATFVMAGSLSITMIAPASAHKVIADAYASDDMIEGEVGFSNGDMAKNIIVEIFDPAGTKMGEVTTDEEGVFLFKPSKLVKHVFRANLGAGHVAEFSVAVEDLPMMEGAVTASNAGANEAPETMTASAVQMASASQISAGDLRGVKQELKLLRKEISAYKEKNDFQTILGGLGYIVGLCGLYVFFLARREKK